MAGTLGYHIVISGYGLWLPGDHRGHWSAQWDQRIGYTEPHKLHRGDADQYRKAKEKLKHQPLRLSPEMIQIVTQTMGQCVNDSDWHIAAASIESTHTHLLMTCSQRDIDHTIKWLKDQTAKAIHLQTDYQGPVWCVGRWCTFIFDHNAWHQTQQYIQCHNQRRNLGPNPHIWINPDVVPR